MLVVHAAIGAEDDVLVWAERADAADAPPPRHGAAGRHPFAASAQLLERVLGTGEPTTVHAMLPTTAAGTPRPSYGDGDPAHELRAWTLPAMRLELDCAIDLLGAGLDDEELVDHVAADAAALGSIVRACAALALRQDFLPGVRTTRLEDGRTRLEARWEPLPGVDARDAFEALLDAVPEAAVAVVREGGPAAAAPRRTRAAGFAARVVDSLVRARTRQSSPDLAAREPRPGESLHDRWLRALVSDDPVVDGPSDALDRLAADVHEWQHRARTRVASPWRLCLRLEEPDDPTDDAADDEPGATWNLRYFVQRRDDPSVLVPAEDAWAPTGVAARTLRAGSFHAGEHLLAPLAEAARWFEPIADSLHARTPTGCSFDTATAHAFLADVAPLLERSGCAVQVPAWWRGRGGRWQVSLRAQLQSPLEGGRQALDSLNLRALVEYDWRVAVGDATLSRRELERLAAQKSSLVRVRGRWVELDHGELEAALRHMRRFEADPLGASRPGAGVASVGELARMSTGAVVLEDGTRIAGVDDAEGTDVAALLTRAVRDAPDAAEFAPPAGLEATLRPYQLRGAAWLARMASLGLGACLADDMGLGKSVQALAAVLHAWNEDGPAPTLVVCPTSVLTNWQREAARFTPTLPVLVHHGPRRARDNDLREAAATRAIVLTSYSVLVRDAAALADVPWRMVVLDEAQHVKNPSTRQARAVRMLRAPARVALTGTPIENHAGDLWSIMEFLNPGLLGSAVDFRRKYLVPIQTGTFPEAAERLRRIVEPFVLRREKVDRDVIDDLPDRFEHVVPCLLTTEQASLYEAIVRDAATTLRMRPDDVRRAGIERRGLILATIARLKQVCNHPAQLLGDNSRIAGRSGKLARLEQLLETVLEAGDRALVFTQFVQMGELLQRHLADAFGREVLLLHGGTPRAARDRIVDAFQSDGAEAPPVLVLSLKAGGSGLNLTAATHVFHFDRWWNPATEQQASDRAFRIGQTRDVQVHALVCSGTVEERVDAMLRQKRAVSDALVGTGERWITEFDDDELLDLLRLREDTMLQEGRLDHLDPKEWQRGSL